MKKKKKGRDRRERRGEKLEKSEGSLILVFIAIIRIKGYDSNEEKGRKGYDKE